MMPHARLQPIAPMSIVRTSSRSASATLSEPVKVRTMIRPNSTSETRSIGSRIRLDDLPASSGIRVAQANRAAESRRRRREQVKRYRENRVDHQEQNPQEPRRAPAVRHE